MLVEVFYKLLETAGVDKSTVSRVVTNVSNALIAKQSEFITWPTDAEVAEVKNSFYRCGGFPCVIGCLDGSHIRIQEPNEHENAYVNHKGFHSINVQGVCNHEVSTTSTTYLTCKLCTNEKLPGYLIKLSSLLGFAKV